MKKKLSLKLLLLGVFVVFVGIILAESLIIKVKTTSLKKEPVFYSDTVAVLNNGEQVEKIGEQQGWYKVRTQKGQEGWLHSSAVQKKKFSLFAVNKQVKSTASAQEVALAGKGFNKQVEEKYKAKNPSVNFIAVDRMLKLIVTPRQLKSFLEKGKLGEFGGGQ